MNVARKINPKFERGDIVEYDDKVGENEFYEVKSFAVENGGIWYTIMRLDTETRHKRREDRLVYSDWQRAES